VSPSDGDVYIRFAILEEELSLCPVSVESELRVFGGNAKGDVTNAEKHFAQGVHSTIA
jgi:hypothetical protein